MNPSCPICGPDPCPSYPHLRERLRRDLEGWRRVHDRVVAAASGQVLEAGQPDRDLRAYLEKHPCCP